MYCFSSESVSPGHPDKIADQISDAILDAILAQDKQAKVACECLVKTGMVLLAGEINTQAWVDMESIVRQTLHHIGYENSIYGFSADHVAVINTISQQSPDIYQGVVKSEARKQGAGDQGLMFGYATTETQTFMPAAISLAHRLMQAQHRAFKDKQLPWLGPDAKAQVAMIYDENRQPVAIKNIVLSTQHLDGVPQSDIVDGVMDVILQPHIPTSLITADTAFFINPSGRFVLGGPAADCGLTGRKIIVDSYGGMARHGGGAFSGKDPSKVDRSAAYMARYLAKNIVYHRLATTCEVQLAYAIGQDQPTSIRVETFGTSASSEQAIEQWLMQHMDLSPYGIIQQLQLLQTQYQPTATFGHFGREAQHFTWERTDNSLISQASDLKKVPHDNPALF